MAGTLARREAAARGRGVLRAEKAPLDHDEVTYTQVVIGVLEDIERALERGGVDAAKVILAEERAYCIRYADRWYARYDS